MQILNFFISSRAFQIVVLGQKLQIHHKNSIWRNYFWIISGVQSYTELLRAVKDDLSNVSSMKKEKPETNE